MKSNIFLTIFPYSYFFLANAQGHDSINVTKTELSQQDLPQAQSEANNTESTLDLDSMHLMLEPHLRPATPDPNSPISMQIFDEHNKLAQEYLKVN